jgi:glycosyltransferase involved in cell wall biosynthesis
MSGPASLHVHAVIDGLGCGGAQLMLADFAELAPLAGVTLTVGYLREERDDAALVRLRELGVDPVLVGATSLVGPADVRRVRRHLARIRPTLVHTHLKYADVLGGVGARSLGIPAVSTLHEAAWYGTRRETARQRVAALARRACADRLIAVSEAARSNYLATGWDRPERVATVYNGIAASDAASDGERTRARLGLEPGDLVMAMVSVLRREKGHEVALSTFASLRRRFPRLRLLIVGDGPRRAEIERMAAELGPSVVMAGYQADVASVLSAADVLLHPSYVDAFPTALLQAMAASVPVVATAVGGIPEILGAGTGILVASPPEAARLAAALVPVLEDSALRRRIGSSGRERFVRRFTAESWMRGTRAVYEQALASHPRRLPFARRSSRALWSPR